ncbi:MAG TPA: hypothetical protein VJ727_00860 [Rhodanobacteraceae bacterium]|nr:hypothetical protein [Rhodanobacteraceae bacterium]
MSFFKPTRVLPLLLAVLHLILCAVDFTSSGWPGFFVFLADFPISVVLGLLTKPLPQPAATETWMLASVIFGTLWWYFLGCVLTRIATFVYQKLSNITAGSGQNG